MQKCIFFILAFQISTVCCAQVPKAINSIKDLTDSIAILVRKNNIPGLMLGITTKDSVLYSGGFGYADIKIKRPVTNRTRFRLGSITKSFMAIAIQKLVEQGKLNLNDPLKEIAPEIPFTNKWENSNPVRIVNLLENTSGFDDFKLNKMYSIDQKSYSTKKMMLLQQSSMSCRWRPSERYTYCNVNYVILAYIIYKLTGMEYDQYLTDNILTPLNMNSSGFNAWSRTPDQNVKEYSSSSGHLKEVPSVTLLPAAAGSLWSSSDDMIKFLQLFLKNGFPILKPASISRMETPTSSLAANAGLKSGYALGNEDFGRLRGHDGILGTCRSSYRYDRQSGYGFVISSNANGLAGIESLINGYLMKNKPTAGVKAQPLNIKEITPYFGYYQLEDPRFDLLAFVDRFMLVKIEVENDTVNFNIVGKKHKLLQTTPLIFIQPGSETAEIAFATNGDGKRVLIINKHYAEQVSAISAISWRIVMLLAGIFAMLSVLMGFGALFYFTFKKLSLKQLKIRVLPMISVMFLSWGIYFFMEVKKSNYLLYQLQVPGLISISIFLGFTLFGIFSILNLFIVFKEWTAIRTRLSRWIIVSISFSLVFICYVLLINGWIGLMTWTL
ncbi:hypothetical protein N180_02015 [Pedobacter antarcticus 4BY]|uniref:Beta-lactamase-related domain-containing protein n=2 Tax=Pedobacter antarcticus TaxID=34086 RepID=A0A081PCK8_9SPHI|nr:serine hydrolase domain-containing protein [Pedobacter antarcticus]KEQ28431.1 hypothetical protein N180_02015 [Pedobacter antarcticus 4BY]SFF04188.1 CubicO group peptidase, beta-lactamase class C family [Pedobacter antarcticus]